MDREHKKHMQTVRLVITEVIMVVAVVILVIVLTFLAMGYNVNKDGELGQSGLIQLRSVPSGATVAIDGDTIIPRTGLSRMLTAGEHTIHISKDGYDSWEKPVDIVSGHLIKLEYIRLFLQDRRPENLEQLDGELLLFLPAFNRDYALAVINNAKKELLLYDLRGDEAKATVLNQEFLNGSTILAAQWNYNSDKLIVQTRKNDSVEWLLLNVRNQNNSINLTKEFAMNFSEIQFATESGDKLLALENGNLRAVSVNDKTISQVMASSVQKIAFDESDIFYLTSNNIIKRYDDSDAEDDTVFQYPAEQKVNFAISEYLDQKYLSLCVDKNLSIYKISDMEKILEETIDFIPDTVAIYGGGELVMTRAGNNIAVYDAEVAKLSKYQLENDSFFMVDEYMVGSLVDGKLVVRDFDGTNRREIADANSNAVITKNNKWLYYFTVSNEKYNLTREKILE